MLSAHTRQYSKQVLTVLLYFIGHCSVIYTAEDVEPAIVRRRLLL